MVGVLYRFVRWTVSAALRLWYRVQVRRARAEPEGAAVYVGNHPNSLIDPALVFIASSRRLTFLAKAPLFKIPILGQLLRGLGALPVYRKQDNPTLMSKNEAMFETADKALLQGRALMLFPEGRSHSEPSLGEMKSGAARMVLRASSQGASVNIVPVGLTYAQKSRFRSEVTIEVGLPLLVRRDDCPLEDPNAVATLTRQIGQALERITLNLESWDDLPLVTIAEELYAWRLSESPADQERLRAFARGLRIFRVEQPDRYQAIRGRLLSFHRRLAVVHATPRDLSLKYDPKEVAEFVARNLAILVVGLPLAILGLGIFAIPFYVPRWIAAAVKVEEDVEATVKFLAGLILGPIWVALLAGLCAWKWGWPWALAALALSLPVALITRYFVEHHQEVIRDAQIFFQLGNRSRLKQRLVREGNGLAAELETIAVELRPRVLTGT